MPASTRHAAYNRCWTGICVWLALSLWTVCPQPLRAATCERFGPESGKLNLVFLHGSAGAEPYRALAQQWATEGYVVLFPHYYDAASATSPTDAHYGAWVDAVRDCIKQQALAGKPVVLFGISLGASVALAAGTVLPNVDSVVDWAGSLPDTYFYHLQRLPPLLILHGDDDSNVPVVNARQLFELCRRVGTTCYGTIYRHDGHVFPNHRDDAKARTRAFLQSRVDLAGGK